MAVDAARVIVDHVTRGMASDLPAASLARSGELILDTLGAAVAAHAADGIPGLRELVVGWGGRPDSTIIGLGTRVPAHHAAMVNSAAARALELDDVHEQALVHATATVVPVALAVAEQRGGVTGPQLLRAVTLANDIACRLALAVDMELGGQEHRPRVMSLTYQTGVLAGSLAAAVIGGLEEEEMLNCFGVAYSQVAGNLQGLFEGTLTVRVQQGIAAQSAVLAFELSRAGITGTQDSLEGRAGWFPAFYGGRYSRDRLLAELGERFEGDQISIKPYSCCKYGHNPIAAAVDLHRALPAGPAEIDEVIVRVGRDVWDIICDPIALKASPAALAGPDGLALSQFSLPFMVSTALIRGQLTVSELKPEWRSDLALAEMLGKVRILMVDDSHGVAAIPEPGRVEVVLKDGRHFEAEALRTLGHPDQPMDTDTLHAKFRACTSRLGDKPTQQLLDLLTHLDDVDDVGEIARLAVPEDVLV